MIEIADVKKDPSLFDTFIEQNIPLVKTIVYKYFGQSYCFNDIEEYVQVGSIGLIKAVRKFDPEFNVKFSTYAVPVIIGEIRRYNRDYKYNKIKLSRTYTESYFAYKKLKDSGLSDDEICVKLKISPEKFKIISSSKPPEIKSIHETVFTGKDGTDVTLEELISDPANIEEKIISSLDLMQSLKKMKHILSETDYMIFQNMIRKRSQKTIGESVGISQVHVSRRIAIIRKVFKQVLNGESVQYLIQKSKNKERDNTMVDKEQVKKLLAEGKSIKEVAATLNVSYAMLKGNAARWGFIEKKCSEAKEIEQQKKTQVPKVSHILIPIAWQGKGREYSVKDHCIVISDGSDYLTIQKESLIDFLSELNEILSEIEKMKTA